MSALIVKELSIFFFSDCCLYLIDGLFHEYAVLHVQDTIGIALEFGVVSHHDARGTCVLAVTAGSNAVDIEEKIHNRDCSTTVQVTCGLI